MRAISMGVKSVLILGILALSAPAVADCQCDDGRVFRGDNGDCGDGSICRLLEHDVTPMSDQVDIRPSREAREQPQERRGGTLSNLMYKCDDGSYHEHNSCPDGSMGHLEDPDSNVHLPHDPARPHRVALSQFLGQWSTWVSSTSYSDHDRLNHVRIDHVVPGTAPQRDLVINRDGTYVWKGIHGFWRQTTDDAKPLILYRGPNGHDWLVSILEDWYGFLALDDTSERGVYYYGRR